jgi:hypothetical protein
VAQTALNQSVMPAVATNSDKGFVPWGTTVVDNFRALMGGNAEKMALIDTSHVTTMEQLPTMRVKLPIWCMPYTPRREETQFDTYMPIFSLRGEVARSGYGGNPLKRIARMPGQSIVATHVLLNQLNGKLKRSTELRKLIERGNAVEANFAFISERGGFTTDQRARQRRALGVGGYQAAGYEPTDADEELTNEEYTNLQMLVALDAQDFHAKIDYLGPLAEVNTTNDAQNYLSSYMGADERYFTYTHYGWGTIHNVFTIAPKQNQSLYCTVNDFPADEMIAIAKQQGMDFAAFGGSTKRKAGANYVGNLSAADVYPQLRFWATNDNNAYATPLSPFDRIKPGLHDMHYAKREKMMLTESRQYRWNEELQAVIELPRDELEGEQEQLNNISQQLYDEAIGSGVLLKMGTIKQTLPTGTTTEAIRNAHYDHTALKMQPHFDIFQHRA